MEVDGDPANSTQCYIMEVDGHPANSTQCYIMEVDGHPANSTQFYIMEVDGDPANSPQCYIMEVDGDPANSTQCYIMEVDGHPANSTQCYIMEVDDLTEGWTFIWHILLAMVVVNVVFILYCYKIGACCFSDCGDDIPLIIFQDVSQGEGPLQPKDPVVKYSSSLGASSVSDSVDPVFKHVLKIKLNSSRSDIIIGKR
ncbi:hypothetical protein BgiMline_013437 [Biomphalaria glabrata]|nr:hypothetical protein BgiMline_017241 [Biomphalaria glabrata]